MKTIKVKEWEEIPENYTGVVKWPSGLKFWFKEGKLHREDGPAAEGDHCRWLLENDELYCSCNLNNSFLDFKNKVVLSKETHELYPKIQKWKILSVDKIYEVLIFPGLEKYISE